MDPEEEQNKALSEMMDMISNHYSDLATQASSFSFAQDVPEDPYVKKLTEAYKQGRYSKAQMDPAVKEQITKWNFGDRTVPEGHKRGGYLDIFGHKPENILNTINVVGNAAGEVGKVGKSVGTSLVKAARNITDNPALFESVAEQKERYQRYNDGIKFYTDQLKPLALQATHDLNPSNYDHVKWILDKFGETMEEGYAHQLKDDGKFEMTMELLRGGTKLVRGMTDAAYHKAANNIAKDFVAPFLTEPLSLINLFRKDKKSPGQIYEDALNTARAWTSLPYDFTANIGFEATGALTDIIQHGDTGKATDLALGFVEYPIEVLKDTFLDEQGGARSYANILEKVVQHGPEYFMLYHGGKQSIKAIGMKVAETKYLSYANEMMRIDDSIKTLNERTNRKMEKLNEINAQLDTQQKNYDAIKDIDNPEINKKKANINRAIRLLDEQRKQIVDEATKLNTKADLFRERKSQYDAMTEIFKDLDDMREVTYGETKGETTAEAAKLSISEYDSAYLDYTHKNFSNPVSLGALREWAKDHPDFAKLVKEKTGKFITDIEHSELRKVPFPEDLDIGSFIDLSDKAYKQLIAEGKVLPTEEISSGKSLFDLTRRSIDSGVFEAGWTPSADLKAGKYNRANSNIVEIGGVARTSESLVNGVKKRSRKLLSDMPLDCSQASLFYDTLSHERKHIIGGLLEHTISIQRSFKLFNELNAIKHLVDNNVIPMDLLKIWSPEIYKLIEGRSSEWYKTYAENYSKYFDSKGLKVSPETAADHYVFGEIGNELSSRLHMLDHIGKDGINTLIQKNIEKINKGKSIPPAEATHIKDITTKTQKAIESFYNLERALEKVNYIVHGLKDLAGLAGVGFEGRIAPKDLGHFVDSIPDGHAMKPIIKEAVKEWFSVQREIDTKFVKEMGLKKEEAFGILGTAFKREIKGKITEKNPLASNLDNFDKEWKIRLTPEQMKQRGLTGKESIYDKKIGIGPKFFTNVDHPYYKFVDRIGDWLGIKRRASTDPTKAPTLPAKAEKLASRMVLYPALEDVGIMNKGKLPRFKDLDISTHNTFMDAMNTRIARMDRVLDTLDRFKIDPSFFKWSGKYKAEQLLRSLDGCYELFAKYGKNPVTEEAHLRDYKDFMREEFNVEGLSELLSGRLEATKYAVGHIEQFYGMSKSKRLNRQMQGRSLAYAARWEMESLANMLESVEKHYGEYPTSTTKLMTLGIDDLSMNKAMKKLGWENKDRANLTPEEINLLFRTMDINYYNGISGAISRYVRPSADMLGGKHPGAVIFAYARDIFHHEILKFRNKYLDKPLASWTAVLKRHPMRDLFDEYVTLEQMKRAGDLEKPEYAPLKERHKVIGEKLAEHEITMRFTDDNVIRHPVEDVAINSETAHYAHSGEDIVLKMNDAAGFYIDHFVDPFFTAAAETFGVKDIKEHYIPYQKDWKKIKESGVQTNFGEASPNAPYKKQRGYKIKPAEYNLSSSRLMDRYTNRMFFDMRLKNLEAFLHDISTVRYTKSKVEGGKGIMQEYEKPGILPKEISAMLDDTMRLIRRDYAIGEVRAAEAFSDLANGKGPIHIKTLYKLVETIDKTLGKVFKDENFWARQIVQLVEESKRTTDPAAMREILRMMKRSTSATILWGRPSTVLQQIFQTSSTMAQAGASKVLTRPDAQGVLSYITEDGQKTLDAIDKWRLIRGKEYRSELKNLREIVFGSNILEDMGMGGRSKTAVREWMGKAGAWYYDVMHFADHMPREIAMLTGHNIITGSKAFEKFLRGEIDGKEFRGSLQLNSMYNDSKLIINNYIDRIEALNKRITKSKALPDSSIDVMMEKRFEYADNMVKEYSIGQAAIANYWYDMISGMRLFGLGSWFGQMQKFRAHTLHYGLKLIGEAKREAQINGFKQIDPQEIYKIYKEGRYQSQSQLVRMAGKELTTKGIKVAGGYSVANYLATQLAQLVDPDAEVDVSNWIPQIMNLDPGWTSDTGSFLYNSQKSFAGPSFSLLEDATAMMLGLSIYTAGKALGNEKWDYFGQRIFKDGMRGLKSTTTPVVFSKYTRFAVELLNGHNYSNFNAIDLTFGELLYEVFGEDPLSKWGISHTKEGEPTTELNSILRLLSLYNYEAERGAKEEREAWGKLHKKLSRKRKSNISPSGRAIYF